MKSKKSEVSQNISQSDQFYLNKNKKNQHNKLSHRQVENESAINSTSKDHIKINQIHLDNKKKQEKQKMKQQKNKESEILQISEISQSQQKTSTKTQNTYKRQKVPLLLRQTLQLRAKRSGKTTYIQQNYNDGIGSMIFSKLKKQAFICKICLTQIQDKQKSRFCNCQHVFCSTCLSQYILYKVKMFEQIYCPDQNCHILISQQSKFYKNLPQQTKVLYDKIHKFYLTSNDPTIKLCPKQQCQGIIKIIQNKPRICNQCKTQFCPKCDFQKHKGDCDQQELNFFQNQLHYRQCLNCKIIIEKTEECNHMTCRCKYQFCYLCGGVWSHDHLCKGNDEMAHQNLYDLSNLDQCCGQFSYILKCPLKFFMMIFLIIYFIGYFIIFTLIPIILVFILSILIGLCFQSFKWLIEFLKNLSPADKQKRLLGVCVIVFPFCFLIGIFITLKKYYAPYLVAQLTQYKNFITNKTRRVLDS